MYATCILRPSDLWFQVWIYSNCNMFLWDQRHRKKSESMQITRYRGVWGNLLHKKNVVYKCLLNYEKFWVTSHFNIIKIVILDIMPVPRSGTPPPRAGTPWACWTGPNKRFTVYRAIAAGTQYTHRFYQLDPGEL